MKKLHWLMKLLGVRFVVGDEDGGGTAVAEAAIETDADADGTTEGAEAEEAGAGSGDEADAGETTEATEAAETDTEAEPHGVVERIGKLTARAKTAEEKAAALETENAELKQKVVTTADPAMLLKSGLSAGFATKDEVEIVAQDNELAANINFLRNAETAKRAIKEKHPDWTDEEVRDFRADRMAELTGERAAIAGMAATIKFRVKQKAQEVFDAGMRALKLTKTNAADDAAARTAAAAGKLKTRLRRAPGAIPGGAGGGGGIPTGGTKLVTAQQYEQAAKAVGEDEAALQWVQQARARRNRG